MTNLDISLSLSFSLSPSLFLSLLPSFSLSLFLTLSLFLSLPLSPSLSLPFSLSDRWRGCLNSVHCSEREREREKGGERVRKRERELHACTSRKCWRALSIPAGMLKAFLIHSVSQSACVIIILIRFNDSLSYLNLFCLLDWSQSMAA